MLATILLMSLISDFEVRLDLNLMCFHSSGRATILSHPSPYLLETPIHNVNFKMALSPEETFFLGVNIPTFVYLFLTNNK